MNITLERDHFLAAMQRVIGAVPRKTTIDILQNVAFTVTPGKIQMLATNLDMQATTTCAAETTYTGSFSLPGQTVLDILSNWGSGAQVQLSMDDSDPRVVMKAGRSRYKLPTLDVDAMPVMAIPAGEQVKMQAADLKAAFSEIVYAVSKEATRYFICGIYVHTDHEGAHFVATDGHRLSTHILPDLKADWSAIIPTMFVNEVLRLPDGDASVSIHQGRLFVSAGDVELIGKAIDGSYPDYVRVIPRDPKHMLKVNRVELMQAARRASLVSSEKVRAVKLAISTDGLQVLANGADSEAENEIVAAWDGPTMTTGFNVSYLIEALDKLADDEVELLITDAGSPCLIRKPEGVTVLTPMRV